MPCLVILLALFLPRVTLVLVWLFSNFLDRAYDGFLWPLLGFFFLPLTTLVYAWAVNTTGEVQGIYVVFLILAVLIDVGSLGGSTRRRVPAE